jgi:alanine racemase
MPDQENKKVKKTSSNIGYRPTWAEVDLRNLAHNFAQIKKLLSPDIKILVTVKADAYGHGLIPVSKKLIGCGVDYLGVASIDEGIRLRQAGIKCPLLVLGVMLNKDIGPLFKWNLIPTVCSMGFAQALNRKARSQARRINVHIKVDTGMGRLGVLQKDAFKLVRDVHKLRFVNIEGLFTHFAFADIDKEFTLYQIEIFNSLIKKLNREGIRIPFLHAANSMGVINFKESHFNMVRPGLVIYGLSPVAKLALKLKPVLSLKTKVIYSKRVPKGYGISYGHDYITPKKTTIVNLPLGYGDGYPRNLSNRAPVLIRGKVFKVSGKICMDQIMVDVGNTKIKIGDEVVLIGSQGSNRITAEELAGLSGTIPYEIVCGLGNRIPRLYK